MRVSTLREYHAGDRFREMDSSFSSPAPPYDFAPRMEEIKDIYMEGRNTAERATVTVFQFNNT